MAKLIRTDPKPGGAPSLSGGSKTVTLDEAKAALGAAAKTTEVKVTEPAKVAEVVHPSRPQRPTRSIIDLKPAPTAKEIAAASGVASKVDGDSLILEEKAVEDAVLDSHEIDFGDKEEKLADPKDLVTDDDLKKIEPKAEPSAPLAWWQFFEGQSLGMTWAAVAIIVIILLALL